MSCRTITSVTSGVTYEHIATYDIQRLNKILTTEVDVFLDELNSPFKAEFNEHYFPEALNAVKLYRITYPSVVPEDNNRPITATGLIAIPETGVSTLRVVSYQHGTVFSNMEVPSNPEKSMETRLMIAQFAGQGYMVIAADYFGKGQLVSTETDSYLVKASTQQACLDMLHAAEAVCADLKIGMGELFLSGWSQGAWNTLTFLNKLESLNKRVKATAAASTPTDFYALINRWIHAPAAVDAPYLPGLMALQLNAYEHYYKLPGLADSAIKPEYRKASRDLYLNRIDFDTFYADTGKVSKLSDFLQQDVIDTSSIGTTRYWQIVQENQSYRWRSITPLRIYYGDVDEVIPEYISKLPVDYQQLMGGAEVTAIPSGKYADHRGNFVYAVKHQKQWFDQLS